MTARRKTDHATDAQILTWFLAMVEAEQFPSVIEMPPVVDVHGKWVRPGEKQMGPLGRDYDNARDRRRWQWMRDHQAAVEAWLIARGMFVRVMDGRPSNATLKARALKIAKGGAK